MWRVVYIAPSLALAEALREILASEGFLVMIRSCGLRPSGGLGPHEVLVPVSEAAEAHETLHRRMALDLEA